MARKTTEPAGLTEAQKAKYIRRNGVACPFCDSADIESGAPQTMDNGIEADCECRACKRAWTDVYRLVDVQAPGEGGDGA